MYCYKCEKWNFYRKTAVPKAWNGGFQMGIAELSRCVFPMSLKLFAHYLGNGVNDLVVTSAAACGAVGDALDLIEFLLNVLKFCHGMESVLNVRICYVHTIADNLVFHKKYNLSSGNFPYINRRKTAGLSNFIREYL